MVISLFVMVTGALLFIPAAGMVSFTLFLTAKLCAGHRRVHAADFGEPLCFDSGSGAQCAGAADTGASLQLAWFSDGAAGGWAFILTEHNSDKAAVAHTVQGPIS